MIPENANLAQYRILSRIGAGGMGEVYKALDTRLGRSVALKILPPELSHSADRVHRFLQEAKAASSLNHPNILTVYDAGETELQRNGTDPPERIRYIAMEFVDGRTLREIIHREHLPLRKILELLSQAADGLSKAHAVGIIHRDLKPDNIMVTTDGFAKVLDFGLAKLMEPRAELSDQSTAVRDRTREGAVLGTVAYMSPEQAQGKPLDHRSDIFSLGTILYEAATRRRAFDRDSDVETLHSIVHDEPPPISQIASDTPAALQRVIRRAMAKDPEQRFQSMKDLALELREISSEYDTLPPVSAVIEPRRRRTTLYLTLSVAAAVILALITLVVIQRQPAPARVLRASITPPEGWSFDGYSMAISPDGGLVAFGVRDTRGKSMLWLRNLDGSRAELLEGTEDGHSPFWSPHSRFIGFFTLTHVRKLEVATGEVRNVCAASGARGGTWNRDGTILFGWPGLHRVSASGGSAELFMKASRARNEWARVRPWFLPDGQHFLFLNRYRNTPAEEVSLFVSALGSTAEKFLMKANSLVVYAHPGFLLFVKDAALMAQRFDARKLELVGSPKVISERIHRGAFLAQTFSVSDNRILLYLDYRPISGRLVWFDRKGTEIREAARGDYTNIAIDPTGRRVALRVANQNGVGDIWILDLARNISSRLTFESSNDRLPVWSPDGERIVFSSSRKPSYQLFEMNVSSPGGERYLGDPAQGKIINDAQDWSPDGQYIGYSAYDPEQQWGAYVMRLSDRKSIVVAESPFNEYAPRFSSDGQWVAYESDESGKLEIYVSPFPSVPGRRSQISTQGGDLPHWNPRGGELFYRAPDGKLMSVNIRFEPFEAAKPLPLFEIGRNGFDVAPDGQRFLVNLRAEEEQTIPVTVVDNWPALLEK